MLHRFHQSLVSLCLVTFLSTYERCNSFLMLCHHPKGNNDVLVSSSRWPSFNSMNLSRSALKLSRGFVGPSEEGWEVGNVYDDLDALETAINMSNAEQNLKQAERLEMLNHFARSRRPLFSDVQEFVITPLVFALVIRLLSGKQRSSMATLLAQSITAVSDIHFWVLVVSSPILLLVAKLFSKPAPEPIPEELTSLDPKYFNLLTTDWERPETSSQDHILFLLEYWTSAVAGMAIIGLLQPIIFSFLVQQQQQHQGAIKLCLHFAKLLTRVGVLASLYQYPKQTFLLLRSQQPRPMGFFPTLMQPLVKNMFRAARFALALDMSRILSFLGKDGLIALYSSISVFVVGTWMRLQKQQTKPLEFGKSKKRSFFGKTLYVAATTIIWKKPLQTLAQHLQGRASIQQLCQTYRQNAIQFLIKSCSWFSIVVVPILL